MKIKFPSIEIKKRLRDRLKRIQTQIDSFNQIEMDLEDAHTNTQVFFQLKKGRDLLKLTQRPCITSGL